MKKYCLIFCFSVFSWIVYPVSCLAADWDISSETILRTFQRDTTKGDDRNVLPLYEYLSVDYGDTEEGGISFQGYGWVRKDLTENESYKDDPDGELLYAYLAYTRPHSPYKFSIGRQHIFSGVANNSVDGLRADFELNRFLSVAAYGGIPVELEDTNGRTQDSIYGGRLTLLPAVNAELGFSYKNLQDNGENQEQNVGADFYWSPIREISLDGQSTYNLDTNRWCEHNYSALTFLGSFEIDPQFQYFQYKDYFSPAENRNNLFRFLYNSDEILTIWGADVSWKGMEKIELGLRGRHYNYDMRETSAFFVSSLLTVNVIEAVSIGTEIGRMDGETSEDSYQLYRAFCTWSVGDFLGPAGQVGADLLYQSFDREVYGVDTALFVSLSAGRNLVNDKSFIRASLNYSQDPFFDDDISGIITSLFFF